MSPEKSCVQDKKQQLEPDMGQWTGWISLQSKGSSRVFSNTTVLQCSAFFIVQLSHLYMTTGRIKIARRNIKNLRYADDTTLMAKSEEKLNSLLTKVKEESKKAGLKLNIQKTKIMASGPITP